MPSKGVFLFSCSCIFHKGRYSFSFNILKLCQRTIFLLSMQLLLILNYFHQTICWVFTDFFSKCFLFSWINYYIHVCFNSFTHICINIKIYHIIRHKSQWLCFSSFFNKRVTAFFFLTYQYIKILIYSRKINFFFVDIHLKLELKLIYKTQTQGIICSYFEALNVSENFAELLFYWNVSKKKSSTSMYKYFCYFSDFGIFE